LKTRKTTKVKMREPESQVSYELLILSRGRWQTYNVYTADKEVIAMADAHSMEKVSTVTGVRLIKESYDTKSGKSRQWTTYESGESGAEGKKAGGKMAPSDEPSSRIAYSERSATVRAPDAGTAGRDNRGKLSGSAGTTRGGSSQKPSRSFTSAMVQILVALVMSVVAAMVVMHLASGWLANVGNIPYLKKDDLLILLFILTFVAVSGGLLWRIIMGGRVSKPVLKDRFMTIEPSKPSRWERRRKVFSSRLGRSGYYDPDTDEFDFGPDPGPQPENRQDGFDGADSWKDGGGEEPDAASSDASNASEEMDPEMDSRYSPAMDVATRVIDDFVDSALADVRGAMGQTDAYGLFGMALFIVGAAEGLKQAEDLDDDTHGRLTMRALYSFGMKKERIAQFAGRYEDYLVADPRYMRMFQAGRNAMTDYVASGAKEADAAATLATALVEWNTPRTKAESTAPTAIVFTDIAGSTAMTQDLGDSAAQKIIRLHNRIVREAVTSNGGREVKHTGDGIMASFPNVTGGVAATIEMMKRVRQDNEKMPETPLHLKIGINAGEPISEDDDLFGSSVQLAARLVEKAQPDRIFASEAVHLLCAGKGINFSRIGVTALKGFAEPVTMFEVLWDESMMPLHQVGAPIDEEELLAEEPAEEASPAQEEAPAPDETKIPDETTAEEGADAETALEEVQATAATTEESPQGDALKQDKEDQASGPPDPADMPGSTTLDESNDDAPARETSVTKSDP
ncbi:MAG: adenylate/guanylate cyclase domain-containing protein, partial [Rhodospirillales bacterium]|nr:adenylate/guanylate cyclase domain-containing protein [Rhodospirillales bacterium]